MLEIVQESKLSDVIIFRSSLAKSWIFYSDIKNDNFRNNFSLTYK